MMMIRSYLGHREDHQPVQVAGPNGEVGQTGPCQLERLEVQSGIFEVRSEIQVLTVSLCDTNSQRIA